MAITSTQDARERLLASLPITERRMHLAGIDTALLEGGEGEPVILLHGPGANAAHWLGVIPGLARTHRVIVPDLPGHGASEIADIDMLEWLDALIAATCDAPPALVGPALGGAIAARYAGPLSRLVLVDSLGLAPFEPAPEFGQALHAFMAQPTADTHDSLWRYCAHDLGALKTRLGEQWAAFREYNVDRARRPGAVAAIGSLMERAGAPIPELAAIDASLVWGRHDLATPLAVAEAASERYGWPLHVIEDCADDPVVEQPDALLLALRPLLGIADFRGELVGPSHARYDELRAVFNGMIDRRPALIARCGDAHDVAAAIAYARRAELPLSVYGGGHNVTGNAVCDAGVTIDLRPMKRIEVDPRARTCRAEAGLTWAEIDAATQAHGLAVTGGRVSTTGVGGLVLGGGSGWIERRCGYAVDNLRGIEIVTADGRILNASERGHADLFWGSRGGGGNLGVATRFDLGLHPIGPIVLGGMLLYPAAAAPGVLRNFAAAMAEAPDEIGAGIALLTAPDGAPSIGVIVCYSGPVDAGHEALRPLRDYGEPVLDLVGPMPYTDLQRLIDDGYPEGRRHYWTGDFLTGLPDDAIETVCRFHATMPSPLTQILILPGGGAAARVPDGTMAIAERGAPFNLHITSQWADPGDDEANIAWTRALSAAMKPFTTGRVYVNFIGDEGEERVVASFGAEVYARMLELKDVYDPENLFRTSQNVRRRRSPA
jgi:FAD/FMN-containing dehydrogenase/pimeloyl-ACP methyl ester carboxylesterase